MRKYNYYYNGQPLSKENFLENVPENWEEDLDEYGGYSWGYYEAIQIDEI